MLKISGITKEKSVLERLVGTNMNLSLKERPTVQILSTSKSSRNMKQSFKEG